MIEITYGNMYKHITKSDKSIVALEEQGVAVNEHLWTLFLKLSDNVKRPLSVIEKIQIGLP